MQMSENNRFFSFALDSAHVKFDVWNGPKVNDDDDGNKKPPQICIFDNEKHYFCMLCTCMFHLLTFWRRSRSFYDVKWPILQLCGRCENMMTNVQFVFICPKRWFQFNSRIFSTYFSSIMTLNNWKTTAETRSYIFRWRSRFRRRLRFCLSRKLVKRNVTRSNLNASSSSIRQPLYFVSSQIII